MATRTKKEEVIETKTNIEINNTEDKKVDLEKKNREQEELIKTLKDENKETMSTLSVMQKQMQEMQQAFIALQSQKSQSSNNYNDDKYRQIEIGCRLINGVSLYSPRREVERDITYGSPITVSEEEMNMLLKTPVTKKFLENDVIYFVDKEEYDNFKIFNHIDLSDDKLIELVSNSSTNELIAKLNELTRNKREDALMHSLFYRIVDLTTKNKLNGMKYENRRAIEQYCKFKIETAQMLIDNIRGIK